uniref:Uncharacterized protein n=1 Tax=Peronospora matthiolae TaxID=2874970 RepID=A0AAV1TYI7_9STRA
MSLRSNQLSGVKLEHPSIAPPAWSKTRRRMGSPRTSAPLSPLLPNSPVAYDRYCPHVALHDANGVASTRCDIPSRLDKPLGPDYGPKPALGFDIALRDAIRPAPPVRPAGPRTSPMGEPIFFVASKGSTCERRSDDPIRCFVWDIPRKPVKLRVCCENKAALPQFLNEPLLFDF